MAKITDVDVPSLLFPEGAAPSTPASTKWRLYFKTTGLFHKDDAGAEVGPLSAGGALGAWTDYTPTWTASTTNPTLGSTTIVGRYKLLDSKTLVAQINIAITTGGAWNAGSGQYIFSLPAGMTAHATRLQLGNAHVLDSGTAHFSGTCKITGGATTIGETVIADATGNRLLAHNAPITWATGDQINLAVMLEIV